MNKLIYNINHNISKKLTEKETPEEWYSEELVKSNSEWLEWLYENK